MSHILNWVSLRNNLGVWTKRHSSNFLSWIPSHRISRECCQLHRLQDLLKQDRTKEILLQSQAIIIYDHRIHKRTRGCSNLIMLIWLLTRLWNLWSNWISWLRKSTLRIQIQQIMVSSKQEMNMSINNHFWEQFHRMSNSPQGQYDNVTEI